jgi:hypothetical protein
MLSDSSGPGVEEFGVQPVHILRSPFRLDRKVAVTFETSEDPMLVCVVFEAVRLLTLGC